MPDMEIPDISHLTKEEQEQILSVIKRQKDEEEKEKAMIKTLQKQFEQYKEQVKKASEDATVDSKISPDSIKDSGQVCALCHKTKMADGCGHKCSYCSVTFCSRCGGRVTVKSSKNERMLIWVCNLCRKQQEILTKTGAWYHTEQNRKNLTLTLEPIPANDKGRIAGSLSLAQLENRADPTSKSPTVATKLKKGQSEPQLAICEKSPAATAFDSPNIAEKVAVTEMSKQESKITPTRGSVAEPISKVENNHTTGKETNFQNGSCDGRVTQGVRRSSTNSERRLHRQEQAVKQQDITVPLEENEENRVRYNNASVHRSQESYVRDDTILDDRQQIPGQRVASEKHTAKEGFLQVVGEKSAANRDPKGEAEISLNSVVNVDHSVTEPSRNSFNLCSNITSRSATNPTGPEQPVEDKFHRIQARTDGTQQLTTARDSPVYSVPSSVHSSKRSSDVDIAYEHSRLHSYTVDGLEQYNASVTNRNQSRPHIPDSPLSRRSATSRDSPYLDSRHSNHSSPSQSYRRIGRASLMPDETSERAERNRSRSPMRKGNRKYPKHHSRGHFSDNDTSACHSDCHMSSPKNQSDHRQVLSSFDDVSSQLCHHHRQPAVCSSFNHDMPLSRESSCSCLSCEYYTGNVCHSETNLRRSPCHFSSQETICSRGHRCRRAHHAHLQRRANNVRYSSDYYLHVSGQRRQKSRAGKFLRRKPSLSSTDDELQSTPDDSGTEDACRYGLSRDDQSYQGKRRVCGTLMSAENLIYLSSPWHGDLNAPFLFDDDSAYAQVRRKVQFSVVQRPDRHKPDGLGKHCAPLSSYSHHDSCRDSTHTSTSGLESLSSPNTEHGDDLPKCEEPVTWQPSTDNKFLVGRMVLDKFAHSSTKDRINDAILGVKVTGGRPTEDGHRGAVVTKIKKGSVADTVGHLKPGDEILMWNNTSLRNATYEEVCSAVAASKDDRKVTLVVSRPIKDVPRIPETRQKHPITESSSSSFDSQKREDEFALVHMHPYNYQRAQMEPSAFRCQSSLPGKLQVCIYFDEAHEQLRVKVIKADELSLRPGGQLRNPYVKMYLLPDRSEISKQRSKTLKKTVQPLWDQTFTYGHIRRADLGSLSLEISLWDLDHSLETNSHFLGEVLIDLGLLKLDGEAQWYKLMSVGEGMNRIPDQSLIKPRFSNSHQHADSMGAASRKGLLPSSMSQRIPASPNPIRINTSSSLTMQKVVANDHQRPIPKGAKCGSHTNLRPTLLDGKDIYLSPAHHSVHRDECPKNERSGGGEYRMPGNRNTALDSCSIVKTKDQLERSPRTSVSSTPPFVEEKDNQASNAQNEKPRSSARVTSGASSSRTFLNVTHEDGQKSAGECSTSERLRRRSSERVKSRTDNIKDESLPKSASLGANLHNKQKGKANSKANQNAAKPKNGTVDPRTTSPGRKRHAIGQKLTNLVGMKSRSQGSLESDKAKNSSPRSSDYGLPPEMQMELSRESASGSWDSNLSEESQHVAKTVQSFVGEVGLGQVVSLQTLTSSCLGEIEVGLHEENDQLEVHLIRARNLVFKPNAKAKPVTYLKIYLMFGSKVVGRRKTNPLQRKFDFRYDTKVFFGLQEYGNNLRVSMYGDYGMLDNKVFMGVVQIDLAVLRSMDKKPKIGWYKLFDAPPLINPPFGSKQGDSTTSLDSDAAGIRR